MVIDEKLPPKSLKNVVRIDSSGVVGFSVLEKKRETKEVRER